MSSLFGLVGNNSDLDRVSRVSLALRHAGHIRSSVLVSRRSLSVGAALPGPATIASWHADGDAGVAVAGSLRIDRALIDAPRALELYGSRGLAAFDTAEGAYTLLISDASSGRASLQADVLGTAPVCYGVHEGAFAFGPDPRATLGMLNRMPRLHRDAALQFLLNRYLIGDITLFDGIRTLLPGERAVFDLTTGDLQVQRYWDLRFGSTLQQRGDAETALHEVLEKSHEAMLEDIGRDGDWQLCLTGGMDSRGVLGFARDLGHLPSRALTWGACDSIPGSDPVIARAMADSLGVPFSFCPIDGQDWAQHAADWLRVGTLETDNANSYATPIDYFTRWRTDQANVMVLGDEMFGAGAMPRDPDQAVANIMRRALREPDTFIAGWLKPESHCHALKLFETSLQTIVDRCQNDHPKDLQDYLFFHTYIARWILAPGNFKLPLYETRRPLMTRAVIDCVQQLSPMRRVDKSAFVDMMTRRFGWLTQFPLTSAESSVDWSLMCKSDGPLRDLLQAELQPDRLRRLPISPDLDLKGLEPFLAAFFADEQASRASGTHVRGRIKRSLYDLRRVLSRSSLIARAIKYAEPLALKVVGQAAQDRQEHRHQVVMRLALLSMLQRQIDEGTFAIGLGSRDRYSIK
ncbi:MAG: hypothetical protein GVY36_02595 [Verrucomicrobia bacterium]|jgi:hypothetical protein|nr:hypothetical protein [Verrucomicrobiota bacterium]